MSLIRRSRQDMMPTLLDDTTRWVDQFFRSPLTPFMRALEGENFAFGPAVDVYETDTELVVKAELPGVSKEDIELTFEDDRIMLHGESRHEEETREEGYHRREIRCGSFRRVVPLPVAVKQDEIAATFEDGVLTIRAPKTEEKVTGKPIEIT